MPATSRISILFAAAVLTVVLCMTDRPAHGQSLVEMYRSARFQAQAERLLELNGASARPMPVERVPYQTDSIRSKIARLFPKAHTDPSESRPAIRVEKWQSVPKLGRSWFEKKFQPSGWSFLGSNALNSLDTTFTRELRARLEAAFGAPTQTLADIDSPSGKGKGEYIQFEYWLALNDSIPLKVMDVNGPFERGLVVASAREYRHLLPDLKQALIERLTVDGDRVPYADYYYLPEQKMWFLTGFDGNRFFLKRIPRPDLKLGRPLLDAVRDR